MLDMTAQRLYCLGLVGPVALLLASSALALVLRRDAPVRIWLPWLVLQSAAFAFYGILRADAQWTFLLVAGAAVLFLHRPPLRNGRADGFFRRCAEEIRTALDDDRLEKRDALVLSPFTDPIDFPRLRKILLHSLRNGFGTVLSRKGFQAKIPDVEDSETLRALEDVAGERIPYRGCDLESVRVRAFFLPADSSAKTRLLVSDGKSGTLVPKTVFRDYPAGSGTDGRASARPYADIAVTSEMMDLPSARLSVSLNRRTVWEGPLASAREMSSAELEADVRVDEKRRDGPPRLPLARRSTAVANRLLSVSRFLSPVPCAALLVHALLGIRLLFPGKRFRTDVRLWLFGTGLLLVAWAVLFVCSANFFEAMPDGFPVWYAVGAYAVLVVFAVLSFICLLRSASGRDERP